MRVKFLVPALAACSVFLGLASYLEQRPPSIAQPLPERLEGRVPILPPHPSVTRLFPVELEGEVVPAQTFTARAPVDSVVQFLHDGADGKVLLDETLAILSSAELTLKRLDSDSKLKELEAMLPLYTQSSSPDSRKLQAALDGGKQRYRYAQATFQKVEELFQRGLVSGKEHADALVQLEADKFALAAAERDYADARLLAPAAHLKIYNQLQAARLERQQLDKTEASLSMRAPFAGELRRYAPPKGHDADAWSLGSTVKAGDPLFHIASSSRMVMVDAGPAVLPHFTSGDSVQVTSGGENPRTFEGLVQEIIHAPYESAAPAFGESVVQIRVAVADPAFSDSESHKVVVSKALPQQGIPVPVATVLSEGGELFLYVRPCTNPGAHYIRRRVLLSAEQEATALVTHGLVEGECIADISERQPWNR